MMSNNKKTPGERTKTPEATPGQFVQILSLLSAKRPEDRARARLIMASTGTEQKHLDQFKAGKLKPKKILL